MIPVDQIIFEDGKGDCLRACVASILHRTIDQVPNFWELIRPEGDLQAALDEWLQPRGYSAIRLHLTDNDTLKRAWVGYAEGPASYVVLSGDGPRVNASGKYKQHAVVGQPNGYGFKIVHDPHPSRAGLITGPFAVMWIVRSL